MNIHFACLFCPDYDMDMITHWTEHYVRYGFDRYNVWLHSPSGNTALIESAGNYLGKNGFNVMLAPEKTFGCGSLRHEVLEKYRISIPAKDKLVTVDSDEIIGGVHSVIRQRIADSQIVWAKVIDCWGKDLIDAMPGIPLSGQYPEQGIIEERIREVTGVAVDYRDARLKILSSDADVPVSFHGSHMVLCAMAFNATVNGTYPCPPEHPENVIYHYSWRGTKLRRLAERCYHGTIHVEAMQKFFGIEGETPELLLARQLYETNQKKKGWW